MSVRDQIRGSYLWASGESFSVQDMVKAIKVNRNSVIAELRNLGDQLQQHSYRRSNGVNVVTYCRKSLTADWIRRPLVSGEFSHSVHVPGEWR